MAASRVVVYKADGESVWRVQSEGPRPKRGGVRKVIATLGMPEMFSEAHELALASGAPVYVPKFAYDPLEDEPGWDSADGAPVSEIDALHDRTVRRVG